MRHMKRTIGSLATVALVFLVFSACATPGSPDTDDIEFRVQNQSDRTVRVSVESDEKPMRTLGEVAPGEIQTFEHDPVHSESPVQHQLTAMVDGQEVRSSPFPVDEDTEEVIWRLPVNEVLVDQAVIGCSAEQPGCAFPGELH